MKKKMNEPSQDVVNYLRKQGKTLAQIGRILNVEESYISRVSSGTRNLTLTHMQRLARSLDMPLPELLLAATPLDNVPARYKSLYKGFLHVMRLSDSTRQAMDRAEKEKRQTAKIAR